MPAHEALSPWESFYVIVGSSAAALTGLQFVVIAIVADSPMRGGLREVSAFGTPTVVHFSGVLLLSAILSAPWVRLPSVAVALGVAGIAGTAYTIVVWRRARRTEIYTPVLEDWIFHVLLPLAAYLAVLGAAVWMQTRVEPSLFLVAGAALLLLFIGIHNAWDTVTYVALLPEARDGAQGAAPPPPPPPPPPPHPPTAPVPPRPPPA